MKKCPIMYPPLITYNVPFWNCFGMSIFLIMYPFEIIFEVPPLCTLSISYNVPLFKLFLKCHISYNVPFWKFSGYAGGGTVHYRTNYCTPFFSGSSAQTSSTTRWNLASSPQPRRRACGDPLVDLTACTAPYEVREVCSRFARFAGRFARFAAASRGSQPFFWFFFALSLDQF